MLTAGTDSPLTRCRCSSVAASGVGAATGKGDVASVESGDSLNLVTAALSFSNHQGIKSSNLFTRAIQGSQESL